MTDPRAVMAARNNADLYRAVFASQSKRFDLRPYAFVALDPPPAYYSALTILSPGHAEEIAVELDHLSRQLGGEVGFKDSFCEFPPNRPDLHPLFEASWLYHPAMAGTAEGWHRVETAEALWRWEAAWKGNGSPTDAVMFGPALLDRPDIAFLAKADGAAIVAGCIANLSADCIGLSNVFAVAEGRDAFAEAARATAALRPDLPLVGYAYGAELEHALAAGFAPTGPLRVFLKRG